MRISSSGSIEKRPVGLSDPHHRLPPSRRDFRKSDYYTKTDPVFFNTIHPQPTLRERLRGHIGRPPPRGRARPDAGNFAPKVSRNWPASRSGERLFCALPIGDGGTKGGATYGFRPETAMLAWSGSPQIFPSRRDREFAPDCFLRQSVRSRRESRSWGRKVAAFAAVYRRSGT
jgi:hypothetical protein